MDIEKLLVEYKNSNITHEQMLDCIKKLPFSEIEEAKIDFHRHIRSGNAEVIYGEFKTFDQIKNIVDHIIENTSQDILITRVKEDILKKIQATYNCECQYGTAFFNRNNKTLIKKGVLLISAGTADIPVCKECLITLKSMGINAKEIYDVGVCGLHRILSYIDDIQKARVIIVAAGMEGALASVVSGLCGCNVIGVPTSVGYGSSFSGISAMLGMLNSCANRVSVVNIDNGYGAACIAASIVNGGKNEDPVF